MQPREFLASIGTADTPHGSRVDATGKPAGSFFDHLTGAEDQLREWGCTEAVCMAGLFHSVYGTEGFQGFTLPLSDRPKVREVIGERAERIAFYNCVMDRHSLDTLARAAAAAGASAAGPLRLRVRPNSPAGKSGRQHYELSERDFLELMMVVLADHLEGFQNQMMKPGVNEIAHDVGGQAGYWRIPQNGWFGYRQDAFEAMATCLGGIYLESWRAALATVPAGAVPAQWLPRDASYIPKKGTSSKL